MQLSPAQRAAVEAAEPRVAVVAGAGSGKTRVLTERVAHLVEARGAAPERIVALTFTRAAAAEMRGRVAARLDDEAAAAAMYIGTFHGLAFQLLQRHAEWAGRHPGWVLWEPRDVALAAERAAQDAGAKVRRRRDAQRSVDVEKTFADPRARRCYDDLARRYNALDYDGMEKSIVAAAARGELDDRWDHLLVDEAQDCSAEQWAFVIGLVRDRAQPNLFVVGDPRQSIYRFRGAMPEAFVEMLDAPAWTTYHLATNYRSRPGIVEAANRIARTMLLGLPDCEAARETDRVDVVPIQLADETGTVADSIADFVTTDALGPARGAARDVAVLARRWRDLDGVEAALQARGIPTRRLRRPPDPFDSPEGRVVLAALRLCVDPHDDLAAETLGAALGEDVGAARLRAATERRSLLECLPDRVRDAAIWPELLLPCARDIACHALEATGTRRADLPQTVAARIEHGVSPADVLAARAAASTDEPADAGDVDAVTLVTVHSAKGLEWPVVYVVGCAEGAWPTAKAARDPDDLAEERRLFYVAATRARDNLVVTSPATRQPWSGAAEEPCELSRFVREMEGR